MKEKIETSKGSEEYPAHGQKLIYSGKILADEKPLKEYSIDEGKFIVVMIAKPKPVTTPTTTPASTPATETTATQPVAAAPTAPTANTTSTTTPTSESAGQPAAIPPR